MPLHNLTWNRWGASFFTGATLSVSVWMALASLFLSWTRVWSAEGVRNKQGSVASEELGGGGQRLPTHEYVDLRLMDSGNNLSLRWNTESGQTLFVSTASDSKSQAGQVSGGGGSEETYVILRGHIDPFNELKIDGETVAVTPQGEFRYKLVIPLEPHRAAIQVYSHKVLVESGQLLSVWLQLSPALKFRVKEGSRILEKGYGGGKLPIEEQPFVQLFSRDTPITHMDVSDTRHAELTFRIYPPVAHVHPCDRWALTIQSPSGQTSASLERIGRPPQYVAWDALLKDPPLETGLYTYTLVCLRGDKEVARVTNSADVWNGFGVVNHTHLPALRLDPQAIFGYLGWNNPAGTCYSTLYTGVDVTLALWDSLLLRGAFLGSAVSGNPLAFFNYERAGFGARLAGGRQGVRVTKGSGEGEVKKGGSEIAVSRFYLDIFASYVSYFFPSATNPPYGQFAQGALLLEPHFVLFQHHAMGAWAELGYGLKAPDIRFSLGLEYFVVVPSWSARVGIGVAYEDLFQFNKLSWHVTRAYTSLGFTL